MAAKSALWAQQHTYSNSLLVTDLASDVSTGVQVDGEDEVGQTTQHAAVSYSLCILTNDVARAEMCNDTYGAERIVAKSKK